jgi:hypothetical protein
MVAPRDVILIWDRHTHPNKWKLHICVCPKKQLFLRVNSNPFFPPHHPIPKSSNTFLDHDSYVELQGLVRHFAYEIGKSELKGRMSMSEAKLLVEAAWKADTLTHDQKELIDLELLSV